VGEARDLFFGLKQQIQRCARDDKCYLLLRPPPFPNEQPRISMRASVLALAAVTLAACSPKADDAKTDSGATTAAATTDTSAKPAGYTAAMRDSAGHDLGTLTLSDVSGGIMIMGDLKGLPAGEHGIHLHMTGSCEPTFAAAGGHWNPTNKEHGKDNPKGAHLGDTPNITVGADGSVSLMVTSPGGSLKAADALMDADGAAIVIHAKADDYKSQPAGNAGDRIACGAIKG
jgi:superoxide dismutase, Cu-Zn family